MRTGPEVADWNGDGMTDLLVCFSQDEQVIVLFGGKSGLSLKRSVVLPIECRLHYQNRIDAADFDGDGRADLALFGYTRRAGVGSSGGPSAVFIRRHPGEK